MDVSTTKIYLDTSKITNTYFRLKGVEFIKMTGSQNGSKKNREDSFLGTPKQ
jgi:hypothetical protein